MWLFPLTYCFHIAEEYWWCEGFPSWISRIAGVDFTRSEYLRINAAALCLMTIAVLFASSLEACRFLAASLCTIALTRCYRLLPRARFALGVGGGIVAQGDAGDGDQEVAGRRDAWHLYSRRLMPAYVIVDIEVTDPVVYEDYKLVCAPTVTEHGGRYIVRGGKVETLEGTWAPTRLVVMEFPSAAAAKAWVESDSYRPARAMRHAAAKSRMIVVDGVSAP